MPAPAVTVTAALALSAALAGPALADVEVAVPIRFLGGPIAAPLAVPAALAGTPAGRPSTAPPPDSCRGEAPGDCVVIGPDAELEPAPDPEPGPGPGEDAPEDPDTPEDGEQAQAARPAPLDPPAPAAAPALAGGLVRPAPAGWLPRQTPLLAWRPAPGAAFYNVQVFRGPRRVVNAWTSRTRLRVPRGALEQGRVYAWSVWPGRGPRRAARYAAPLGRSVFQVTLRPRIVLRARGGGGVVGELRPHVPGALVALRGPGGARRVVTDARSRIALSLPRATAERLRARLVTRGPRPPIGLRGGR